MELISVNQVKCNRCGICTEVCPVGILGMGKNGPEATQSACIACGHCVAICPNTAIDNNKARLANQVSLKQCLISSAETAEQFLRARRSIRSYKKDTVPREKLLRLIDIARFAPTAGNQQDVSYIIVEEKEIIKKASETTIEWMEEQLLNKKPVRWSFAYHVRTYRETGIDPILRDAPHLILATSKKDFPRGRENTILSLAYLELYAPALGLGSCWAGLLEMCIFAGHGPLLELFKIPADKVITGAVMVGYPKYRYQRLVDRNPLDVTWL